MTADELWDTMKEYGREINRFPSIQEFANKTHVTYDLISKVYNRWLQQGRLIKNGTRYDFSDASKKLIFKTKMSPLFDIEQPKQSDNIVNQIIASQQPVKHEESKVEKPDVTYKLLKIFAALIGIILIIVSVHFTYDSNKLAMKPFWGFLLSFAIVSYTEFAFTLMSYCDKNITKIVIVILWFLGITYSVFTAVSGQFYDFRQHNAHDNSLLVDNKTDLLNKQLKQLEDKQSVLSYWREQEKEYTENPDLKTENPGTWKRIQKGIDELNDVENNIVSIQNELLDTMSIDVVSDQTVYNWLSSFLKVNPDKVQFWVILFPSLFIDLCSSLCLSFAFGKRD